MLLIIVSGLSLRAQTPVDIYYHVPFIPQPTSVSCWSSSIAMILWWRDNEDAQMCLMDALTPEEVALNIGYFEQYFKTGLDGDDATPLNDYGFITVQPMSFPIATLVSFLRHGPVWVAYEGCQNPLSNCGHAVVLVGIRGDGTPVNTTVFLHDPDDGSGTYPNLGVRDREMDYNEFIERLNHFALRRSGQEILFLAYLRNIITTQRPTTATQESRNGQ